MWLCHPQICLLGKSELVGGGLRAIALLLGRRWSLHIVVYEVPRVLVLPPAAFNAESNSLTPQLCHRQAFPNK